MLRIGTLFAIIALDALVALWTATGGFAAQTDSATPTASSDDRAKVVGPSSPVVRGDAARKDPMPGPGLVGCCGVSREVETGGGHSPAAVNDVVDIEGFGNNLDALDAVTGDVCWRHEHLAGQSSPAVIDGTIYIAGFDNHRIRVITVDGQFLVEQADPCSVDG